MIIWSIWGCCTEEAFKWFLKFGICIQIKYFCLFANLFFVFYECSWGYCFFTFGRIISLFFVQHCNFAWMYFDISLWYHTLLFSFVSVLLFDHDVIMMILWSSNYFGFCRKSSSWTGTRQSENILWVERIFSCREVMTIAFIPSQFIENLIRVRLC